MRSHDAGGVQEWREALQYSPRMSSAEGGEVGRLLAHFLQVCKVWEGAGGNETLGCVHSRAVHLHALLCSSVCSCV